MQSNSSLFASFNNLFWHYVWNKHENYAFHTNIKIFKVICFITQNINVTQIDILTGVYANTNIFKAVVISVICFIKVLSSNKKKPNSLPVPQKKHTDNILVHPFICQNHISNWIWGGMSTWNYHQRNYFKGLRKIKDFYWSFNIKSHFLSIDVTWKRFFFFFN